MRAKRVSSLLEVTVIIFGMLLAARLWLSGIYLFGWMAMQWQASVLVWCVAAGLILLADRPLPALFLAVGHTAGAFAGQYLGDWLRAWSSARITPDMTAGQVAQLEQHDGFFLWVAAMLLCLAAGIAVDHARRKDGKRA